MEMHDLPHDEGAVDVEVEVPTVSQRRVISDILMPFCLDFCSLESLLVPLLLL